MNINQPYPNLDVNGNPVLSTTTATNHGLFYTTRAIPDGKTFYCPGVTSDMSERLTYENYLTTSGQWPAFSRIDNAFVRSSYSYYPQTDKLIRADRPPTVVPFGGYTVAKKITELSPKHSILTDLIYEWNTIPHRSGTTPKAINVVAGDGHAVGFTSQDVFNVDAAHWNVAASKLNGFTTLGPGQPTHGQQFLNVIAIIQL